MASPAKRRKIDNNKSSPSPSRSLDFFFGKQKQELASRVAKHPEQDGSVTDTTSNLTDEQLARKLQAEWNQETLGSHAEASSSGKDASTAETIEMGKQHLEELGNGNLPREEEEDLYGGEDPSEAGTLAGTKLEFGSKAVPPTNLISKNTLSLQSAGSAEETISSSIPFDESPLTFDPLKYVPDLQKHWALEGNDASYSLLTRCFVLVNSTQSRIKIVDTLVNLLRTIIEGDPSSLLPAVRIGISTIKYRGAALRPNISCLQHLLSFVRSSIL
jgi:DNA ligase-1